MLPLPLPLPLPASCLMKDTEEEGNKTKWEHLRRSSRSLGASRGRAQGLRTKKLFDEKMHNSPNAHCKKYSSGGR